MPTGGARARSGPAPDPNALRRDKDGGDWTTLPSAGRPGPAPTWPLAEQTEREAVLWEREWRRPQALIWEANGQELEVAMFVRSVADAENAEASVASRTLVRQQMDSLGVSIPGLLRNRWRIADDAPSHKPTGTAGRSGLTARNRLKVVPDGST